MQDSRGTESLQPEMSIPVMNAFPAPKASPGAVGSGLTANQVEAALRGGGIGAAEILCTSKTRHPCVRPVFSEGLGGKGLRAVTGGGSYVVGGYTADGQSCQALPGILASPLGWEAWALPGPGWGHTHNVISLHPRPFSPIKSGPRPPQWFAAHRSCTGHCKTRCHTKQHCEKYISCM